METKDDEFSKLRDYCNKDVEFEQGLSAFVTASHPADKWKFFYEQYDLFVGSLEVTYSLYDWGLGLRVGIGRYWDVSLMLGPLELCFDKC